MFTDRAFGNFLIYFAVSGPHRESGRRPWRTGANRM